MLNTLLMSNDLIDTIRWHLKYSNTIRWHLQIFEYHSVAFGVGWGGVPEINMFKKGQEATDCINVCSRLNLPLFEHVDFLQCRG
jgi:hypothetical protein